MSKNDYRVFFAKCKSYLKLSTFCKMCDIKLSNVTMFVNGYDSALTDYKLNKLYMCITDTLNKIA